MSNWSARAACRGADSDLFFPETRGAANSARALIICRTCGVREACLEHALTKPEQFGVWGGKTNQELSDMRRARRTEQRIRQW